MRKSETQIGNSGIQKMTKGTSVDQKTSWWLKTIGMVLVAGSLWPWFAVRSFAATDSGATWVATCSIDKDNDSNYKGRDEDKSVYKNTEADEDKDKTPPISTDVTVNFVTTAATPLNPGFNGFNNNLKNAVEYYDINFQQILKILSPGWLRFPGGTDSEAFDWRTGEIVPAWVEALAANPDPYQYNINVAAQPVVAGKGGSSFCDYAKMAANVGGAKIIVSVNAFTDTPESAGDFARYARKNHISVAVWELANEPYTWINSGAFFSDATDYATKMKPYRDAIKAADPDAVVALYFSEAGHPDAAWDKALSAYSPRYWDAVTYHEYVYPGNLTTFDDLMAAANGNLFSNTTSHVTDYLMPMNNPGVTYLISEVSPSAGHGGLLLGTLYGGIYSAEFALRTSTLPQVKYVASFQMLSNAGIDETNDNLDVVTDAYENGTTTNTAGVNFGFFLSAQAAGEAVANEALHNSVRVYATTTTGGPTALTEGGGHIPAVYAQAYKGGNGKCYVVLTNKSASTAVAKIVQDGVVRNDEMHMMFVTGSDPSLVNTNPGPKNVQIQTQVTTPGAVTIPPYSVVRLEW
jgi:alpha-L-arabinofuranosidase